MRPMRPLPVTTTSYRATRFLARRNADVGVNDDVAHAYSAVPLVVTKNRAASVALDVAEIVRALRTPDRCHHDGTSSVT